MKNKRLFLLFILFACQFVFGGTNPRDLPQTQQPEIYRSINAALSQAAEKGYETTQTHLLNALARSEKIGNKNLVILSEYSLAKLDYDFGKFDLAEQRLKILLKKNKPIENRNVLALSHLLLSKTNFRKQHFEEAETHLSIAENIISGIEIQAQTGPLDTSAPIEQNSKQQRSLEFDQLTIILGVTMILILFLLTLAFFKNSKIRSQTTSLLRAKNKQLTEEKNKAEMATVAKTQFLSTITHELRTPIYAVTGLTHLLLEADPSKEQKEHLKSLKFSGEHLLALINNILDFNKLEAKKVSVQLSGFILKNKTENILTTLTTSSKDKNNKLHLEIDENLPEKIIGDHVKLSQVLINLIANAIRFTENGDIWVRINQAERTEDFVSIYFEIEDNGVGIPKMFREEIFENFTQGSDDINSKYGGTGLGLPIVKGILQILGGEIKLKSTTDVGSKFYFTLKFEIAEENALSEAVVQELEAANLKKWQHALSGKKILIVEDNKINQMITQKILSKHLVQCELADNGKIALEKATDHRYDLILMDIHMPVMDGIEATREIRKTDINTPIIALTAVTLDEDLENFLNNGFNDVIPKPYDIALFFQKIYDGIYAFREV